MVSVEASLPLNPLRPRTFTGIEGEGLEKGVPRRSPAAIFFLVMMLSASFLYATIDTRTAGSPDGVAFGYEGDTLDNNIDDDQDGSIDEPDFKVSQHVVGQVFQVLPDHPIVSGISLFTRDFQFGDERDKPVTFRIRIMEWNAADSRPAGEILFESGALTTVQNGLETMHSISPENVLFTAGTPYIVFFLQENPEPSSGNNSRCQVVARSGNPYAGGTGVLKNHGTLGIGGIFAEAFTLQPDLDLAIVVAQALPGGSDTKAPTLAALGRTKLTTARARLTLRGTATAATRVEFRLPRGKFLPAKGSPESWSLSARLQPGRNVILVRATGPGGSSRPLKFIVNRR